MINFEKLHSLNSDGFTLLYEKIDEKYLRNRLIEYGKNEPKSSKYYIGKRNGNFFKGFTRLEKIPSIKVKKFYRDEIAHKNEEVMSLFEQGLFIMLNFKSGEREDLIQKILNLNQDNISMLLFDLFDINLNLTMEQFIHIKNNIVEEYLKKYNELKDNEYKQIEKLENDNKSEIQLNNELKQRLDSTLNELKNIKIENQKLKIKNEKLLSIENFINRLSKQNSGFEESVVNTIKDYIDDNEYKEALDVKINIEKLLEFNVVKYKNNQDISNDLVVQYILIKMMEEI